jgi:hypothetical protein
MPSLLMQRQSAGSRGAPWLSCAWHKRILLGVLVVLMSLCHGVIAPVSAATASDGPAAVAAADDGQPPFRDCAASKRLVALFERRGAAAALDLPLPASALTAHLPEAAQGLRMDPPPIPGNHRAFLQVFRI